MAAQDRFRSRPRGWFWGLKEGVSACVDGGESRVEGTLRRLDG